MTVSDLASAEWRRSSRSSGNDCVELVIGGSGATVRDSKNAEFGHLSFADIEWTAFVGAVKGNLLAAR